MQCVGHSRSLSSARDRADQAVTGKLVVVGFAITAPSKHQIHGIGVGSTVAALRTALGAHEVTSQTSDTKLVAGNADENAGITFTLAAGKVAGIQMGD